MSSSTLDKTGLIHLWEKIEPKEPEEGGSDLSLVDTNEKYHWNNKQENIGFYIDADGDLCQR